MAAWDRRVGGARMGIVVAAVALVGALTSACTPPPDPTAPVGLSTAMTTTGFDVAWDAQPGATAYELRIVDATSAAAVSHHTTDPDLSVTGLDDGHVYRLKVRATGNGAVGGWSSTVESVFVVPVLPVIRLETTDHRPIVSKDEYVPGTFDLRAGGGASPLHSTMQIKGRGNTTWEAPKKPYRIKLDTSLPMLGMTKAKNWVLLADYFDPTHLRNQAAFEAGQMTRLAWTPHARQVEVVLNGTYQGVYEIVENVRIDDTRVDIDQMGPGDVAGDALTGGYLAEIDNQPPAAGEFSFLTPRGLRIHLSDPEVPAPEQAGYLTSTVGAFENTLYSPSFADPTTGYSASLDVTSAIDFYLVNELLRNQDAFLGSTYLTKPRLGRLTLGPLWDFDNSMGNNRGWDNGSATGWFVRRPDLKWIGRLFADPAFSATVAARWHELEPTFSQLPARILADGAAIAPAMDHERLVWTYEDSPVATPAALAAWLQTRIDWIDANIDAAA